MQNDETGSDGATEPRSDGGEETAQARWHVAPILEGIPAYRGMAAVHACVLGGVQDGRVHPQSGFGV
jgi:hypothetical protein